MTVVMISLAYEREWALGVIIQSATATNESAASSKESVCKEQKTSFRSDAHYR